jgi:hypothetical protein
MIITKLIGGLGNQMFQYSVARHLAVIHNTDVKMDISHFSDYRVRKYCLDVFDIPQTFASSSEIRSLAVTRNGILDRLVSYLDMIGIRLYPDTYIKERAFCFDPKILRLPNDVYLDGYWQSEKYFVRISDIIRREFTVRFPLSKLDRAVAHDIQASESVSVHIRRGDYVTEPLNNLMFGTCDLRYYYDCVERLTLKVSKPHFFIFSDDPGWARTNLLLPSPATYVDHNGADRDYNDLRLMSLSKHHIIANSTFSWWGAWLSTNKGKIVFAPKQWLNKSNLDTKDIIPGEWLSL